MIWTQLKFDDILLTKLKTHKTYESESIVNLKIKTQTETKLDI